MEKQTRLMLVVLAIVLASASFCVAGNMVDNSGFEVYEDTSGGWPSSYGDWKGDYSAVEGATSGISPLEGSQMLQLMGSSSTGAGSAATCQVIQILDVSEHADLIAAGGATISASAYFNRVSGDAETDTESKIVLWAWQGDPSTFPTQMQNSSYLDVNSTGLYTDGAGGTWELCSVELALPTNTDFVTIGIYATEDIYNDLVLPEYDGHFADSVTCDLLLEGIDLVIASLSEAVAEKEAAVAALEAAIANQIAACDAIDTMIATGELDGYTVQELEATLSAVSRATTTDQREVGKINKTLMSVEQALSKL